MWYVITAEVDYLNSSNYEYYIEYSDCIDGFGKMTFFRNANSEEEAIFKLKQLNYFNFNKILSVKEYPDSEIKLLVEKAKSELSNFNSFQLPRNPRYVVELVQNDRMVLIRPAFISYEVFRNLINAYANDYQNFFNVLDDIQFDVKDFVKTDKYTVTLKKYSGIGELMETHVLECNV